MPLLRPAAFVRPVLGPSPRSLACSRRMLFSQRQSARATQELDLNKLNAKRREYEQHRIAFLFAGAGAGLIAFVYTAWKLKEALDRESAKEKSKLAVKCDSPIPTEPFKTEAGERRKVVLHDDDGREIVPTGNSVVPTFPRTMTVDESGTQPSSYLAQSISDKQGVEYTLVGLGMRTVTFLGFQVYLVGFYVATQDIARLQQYLIRKVNRLATTLIPSEKETLRAALQDPTQGEQTWDALLQEAGCRSLFRIMPVRDTDFHHLRDGFVRAIQTRAQRDKSLGDESFGAAMKEFKAMFNRGTVPKKKELLLCRDLDGRLSVLYGDGELARNPKRSVLGVVADERFSRLLWLNYLAGANVSSEAARQNIIEGVMEFVGRPVGTVASQVL
ncbi:chalcone isomerase like domain-containing protein [Hirsutella rhossiliensis]|uniref:Chalcone isomerase like domain-containing protein n=1 Tax=Hirsutella rhossiliensis TaxID=111463 RepID=A0A9P8N2G5_9HYPO|nr:chalcone isomerase like domain-containing protein [Hirsutella rhossiliensis]KAH0964721.1 chalcone isomerase like domain-containing protein [Hirsutella rhossiliensis]